MGRHIIDSPNAFHHRDPFDRILIAQSINNNLNIITRDDQFDVPSLRAPSAQMNGWT
jgi:PIN domain nuclease of toxin-antitoxin system